MNTKFKVIAIITRGRSGSTFLQSLLDSHPSLLSTPGMYLTNFFVWYENEGKQYEGHALLNAFVDAHPILFNATLSEGTSFGFTHMGPNKDQMLGINKETFCKHLEDLLNVNNPIPRRELFVAVHLAYAKTLERDIKKADTIVFFLHNHDSRWAKMLISDFPNTKFIHLLREPIQTILAIINHYYNNNIRETKRGYLVPSAFGHLSHVAPVLKEYANESRYIKLEDLHNHSKHILKKLIEFLDIPWNDSLMESTFDGLQWANFKQRLSVSGFNKETTKKDAYADLLTQFDQLRMGSLLSSVYDHLEYKNEKIWNNIVLKITLPFLLLFPFRIEILGFAASDWGRIKRIEDYNKNGSVLYRIIYNINNYIALRREFMRIFLIFYCGIMINGKRFRRININTERIQILK